MLLFQGGSGGFDWGSFGDAFKGASGARQQSQQQRPKRQEEEFYGFNDLFRVRLTHMQGLHQLPPGITCFLSADDHDRTWSVASQQGWHKYRACLG